MVMGVWKPDAPVVKRLLACLVYFFWEMLIQKVLGRNIPKLTPAAMTVMHWIGVIHQRVPCPSAIVMLYRKLKYGTVRESVSQ
jgi:hypothetical protein